MMKFNSDTLILKDGTVISYDHIRNCCEHNYADFKALECTTFEDEEITKENLIIEMVKGEGFRINGYFVPCYSDQNGCYTSRLNIYVNGEAALHFDWLDSSPEYRELLW